MQTFLPYPDYDKTAACLDYRRLGKQRVECKQILKVLLGETDAWKNHPAVKMWEGSVRSLIFYAERICLAWVERGYKDTLSAYFDEQNWKNSHLPWHTPTWMGNEAFHASHRSNLLRKDDKYYGQFGWQEPDNLPYVWPV